MAKVKICGITNLEDALHAANCRADELGFNFYNGSRRYIAPKDACAIVANLPRTINKIGVFVNEPIESVLSITEFVRLDGIQLHGDEDMSYVVELKDRTEKFVVKAFRVKPDFLVSDALDWPMAFPLFDTHNSDEYGGTGKTFDWEEFAADIFLCFPHAAYLAGGLTPENVAEAIRIVHPYSVDVSSGVESSPGKKDPNKVKAFIENAKTS